MRFVIFVVLFVSVAGCAGEEGPLLCEPSGNYVVTMMPVTTTCTSEQQERFAASGNCVSTNEWPTPCVHLAQSVCEIEGGRVMRELELTYSGSGEVATGTIVQTLAVDDLDPCEFMQDVVYTRR